MDSAEQVAEFFLTELRNNDNRKAQILALDHLPYVYKILASLPVFSERIAPALISLAKNSDPYMGEEVLRRLAEQITCVPGIAEDVLVSLAQNVDESAVREVVIRQLAEIYGEKSADAKVSLVSKLSPAASDSWTFGSRMSLAQLLGSEIFAEEEISDRVRREMSSLLQEESPMIRKAAAKSLITFFGRAKHFVPYISDLLPELRKLASDPDEDLRLHAVHACTEIRRNFRSSDVVLPIVARLATDSAPKVRRKVVELWKLDEAVWETSTCLADSDAEVRRLAVLQAKDAAYSSLCILAVTDRDVSVRAAAVEKLGDLYPSLDADRKSEVEELVKKLLILSKPVVGATPAGDLAESAGGATAGHFAVKIAAIKTALFAFDDNCTTLVQEVTALMNDPNWRVRDFVVRHFHVLVKKDKSLLTRFPAAFTDTVSAVRDQAVEMIGNLKAVAGLSWITETLVPRIKELFNVSHAYYHRLVAIRATGAVKKLIPEMHEFAETGLLDAVLIAGLKDAVSNVQICSIRVISQFPDLHSVLKTVTNADDWKASDEVKTLAVQVLTAE